MSMESALAAAAGLVALAFALCTLERWLDRRKRHELAWTVALAMFTLGAGALWLGASDGWNGATFRVFYLFGAILNVPFLALGTIYLLGGRRRGDGWAAGIALAGAFAAGVIAVAPLRAAVPAHRLPQGSEVFGPLPRVLAAVASGAGAMVVLGGAVWSAWRLRRRAGARPGSGRLAAANAVIALGTLVLGASGLLNSVLGQMEGFAVTLTVGITLLFAGFLSTNVRPARVAQPPVEDQT
ncbi:MAG TPA: hypothetical protein VHT97_13315 [Acidimicrobiales bacterium]|jgi:hypothetical protein|nr:hypothetical protein [Acidimicrobiales bacterium]